MFWQTVIAAALLATSFGCEQYTEIAPNSPRKPRVVATVGMLADLVRAIAGERAEVIGLIGPGIDPHLYKPTRSDIRHLASADAVFHVGLMLEGRMGDTLQRLRHSQRTIRAVGDTLPRHAIRYPDGQDSHPDPHVWMDVSLWTQCLPAIEQTLAQLDPLGAPDFARNRARLERQLHQLHDYVHATIATIPPDRRQLVTAHDAFGYFSRAYDIPVRGVQGLSTDSEAGLADIRDLVNFLVQREIPAIFIESSVSPDNLRAVLRGAHARGATLSIGGELFSDAMGPHGTYEGTYIGMMDHNALRIATALGGQPHPGGFPAFQNGTSSQEATP